MDGVLILVFGGLLLLACWSWSCRRHPWRRCLRCNGSGRHEDTSTPWRGTSGGCSCCARSGKSGWHVRPGVRILTPARARTLRNGGEDRFA